MVPFRILYGVDAANSFPEAVTEERCLRTRKQQASAGELLDEDAILHGIAFKRAGRAVLPKVVQEILQSREKPIECIVPTLIDLL